MTVAEATAIAMNPWGEDGMDIAAACSVLTKAGLHVLALRCRDTLKLKKEVELAKIKARGYLPVE